MDEERRRRGRIYEQLDPTGASSRMREVIEYRDNARRPCRIHSSIGSLSAEPRKVRRKGRKGASFGARSVFDSYLGRGTQPIREQWERNYARAYRGPGRLEYRRKN